jgi:hypothetical protein
MNNLADISPYRQLVFHFLFAVVLAPCLVSAFALAFVCGGKLFSEVAARDVKDGGEPFLPES